jgi:hypothetical protein
MIPPPIRPKAVRPSGKDPHPVWMMRLIQPHAPRLKNLERGSVTRSKTGMNGRSLKAAPR